MRAPETTAPAPHQDTDTNNQRPRQWHHTHHTDVDGTVVTLCGMRFTPAKTKRATTGCPICEAIRALEEIKL